MLKNSVSVIIPNYNHSATLEMAITSCIRQGSSLREIIVIDDMSSDDSLVILKGLALKYPGKLFYYSNPIKGGNNARNYGFIKSSGSYIQWLDADDELIPGKFQSQLSMFACDERADVIYSDWYMDTYDDGGKLQNRDKKVKAEYVDFVYEVLSDNWSANANYLFRRSIAICLHERQAWNPKTKVAQDREYVAFAALLGARFKYTPGFFAVYNRRAKDSVSSMDFKTRLGYQLELENKFRTLLISNTSFQRKRKKYLSVLNAHVINACYYAPKLQIRYPFFFMDIDWKIIHYKKYPVVPLIYVWQHIKYFVIFFCKKYGSSEKTVG